MRRSEVARAFSASRISVLRVLISSGLLSEVIAGDTERIAVGVAVGGLLAIERAIRHRRVAADGAAEIPAPPAAAAMRISTSPDRAPTLLAVFASGAVFGALIAIAARPRV